MILATKTVAAIEAAITWDQGSRFRGFLRETIQHVDDAYDTKNDDFRGHLGASLIGRDCARQLWYNFRWVKPVRFEGRLLRLFNRGHLEEARFVAMLQTIGCVVYQTDANGKQFRISDVGGHFGSALDAVIVGCPDVPDRPIIGEFKTHNAASFAKLKSDGVLQSKFEHFVQMQIYMGKNNLTHALYLAVSKDTDELHGEIVQYDDGVCRRFIERARMIISSRTPPAKISESPGFYKCKFCDYKRECHFSDPPEVTCRTCVYASVEDNATWRCNNQTRQIELLFPATNVLNEDYTLTKERQRTGCVHYARIENS